MQNCIKQKKGERKMKKPSKEEIIEALVLVVATAVAILIFTTTFVIARAIVQSVF
jgi:hypothetical protein